MINTLAYYCKRVITLVNCFTAWGTGVDHLTPTEQFCPPMINFLFSFYWKNNFDSRLHFSHAFGAATMDRKTRTFVDFTFSDILENDTQQCV